MVKSVVIEIANKDIPADVVKRDELLCKIYGELQKNGWTNLVDGLCVTCTNPVTMLKRARKGGEAEEPAISLAHDLRLPMTKFTYCKKSQVIDRRERFAITGHGLGNIWCVQFGMGLPFLSHLNEDLD